MKLAFVILVLMMTCFGYANPFGLAQGSEIISELQHNYEASIYAKTLELCRKDIQSVAINSITHGFQASLSVLSGELESIKGYAKSRGQTPYVSTLLNSKIFYQALDQCFGPQANNAKHQFVQRLRFVDMIASLIGNTLGITVSAILLIKIAPRAYQAMIRLLPILKDKRFVSLLIASFILMEIRTRYKNEKGLQEKEKQLQSLNEDTIRGLDEMLTIYQQSRATIRDSNSPLLVTMKQSLLSRLLELEVSIEDFTQDQADRIRTMKVSVLQS